MIKMTKRANWIDWIKVIGLYTIILGHFSAPHYKYIYVFSVQLFFILSGYLSKTDSWSSFIKKTVNKLIVPLLLLSLLYNLIKSLPLIYHNTFEITDLLDNIAGCIYGKQMSLGPCWFIYSLVLCKVVYQSFNLKISTVIAVLCLVFIQFDRGIIASVTPNCFVDTLLAFPVFITGVWLSRCKSLIENLNNRLLLVAVLSVGLVLVVLAGSYNGNVWMYIADCGGSVFWFMVGGIAGTAMIYAISKFLDNVKSDFISIIADGSVIILALHILVVYQSMRLNLTYGYYFVSVIVLIAFIPVVMFCKRYMPVLTGYR